MHAHSINVILTGIFRPSDKVFISIFLLNKVMKINKNAVRINNNNDLSLNQEED